MGTAIGGIQTGFDNSMAVLGNDEAVAARMERQRILTREHPPELWVILDEAVLRRPVGGPGVMREQFTYLTGAARRPGIAIQVIPFGAGAHEGMRGGAFVVADFDSAATIAYQDAASSGQIIEDAADVEAENVEAHALETARDLDIKAVGADAMQYSGIEQKHRRQIAAGGRAFGTMVRCDPAIPASNAPAMSGGVA